MIGYACTNLWGIMMLYVPWAASPGFSLQALLSMVPGLVVCLVSLLLFRQRLSLSGRTPLVAAAALLTSLGTLACTYPTLAAIPGTFVAGVVLSGGFAILLIMAWFNAFAHIGPRGIIVLSGCSIVVTALGSWFFVQCDDALASVLTSLLPMLSFVLLPLASAKAPKSGEDEGALAALQGGATAANREGELGDRVPERLLVRTPGLADVLSAAVPLRTLAGFAITFFVLSSITTIVVGRDELAQLGAPTLVIPLAAALFFVASGFFVRKKIDPSILYKVLLCASAAFVFFSFYLGDVNGALTLHAHNIIEAMAWVVLALGAKKTPVAPHLVFAVGWIAECVGKTLGQVVAPLLASDPLVLMAIVVMLVLLGVGFAFSEGYNLLDIDDEEGEGEALAAERIEAAEGASANARRETPSVAVGETGTLAAASETAASLPCRSERSAAGAESKDRPADGEGIGDHSCGERPDPCTAFCAEYDLSPRESEVFRPWVTGHGLRYIQNALFVSESTVKSHLRSIYRKCDTHNRDEIIALFERETSELG